MAILTTKLYGHALKTNGLKPWAALHVSGQNLGFYTQLRQAQIAIEAAYGGNAMYWIRDDISGMENWSAVKQISTG